ncbi:hypothetical protein HYPSUDRAFT_91648 [Hypholoma sublateritium FD-334 SS-4]|uniref:Uncharacterized protein n=1 Tax=Hypholoma sublateritium (strain FD-334 SS-4) TaxID=945553 RepID=A0A0D2N9S8_HYPSF|nr:hypothetical protein HYPSUDRAFT_91648 [Hypholoma sublateritium FD-334 SS-4]
MPVIAPVQLGPSGRSVARSYVDAISKLVSDVSYMGLDQKALNDDQKQFKKAMDFLSAPVRDKGGKTNIEVYTDCQAKYTTVVQNKTKAFNGALEEAQKLHGANTELVDGVYNKWVEENARVWRNHVQAAYMNWVITGRKEEVEFWFAIVDQDSAMSRVEQSKEVMRWAVVQDSDGSSEYQKVTLEPRNWANLCKQKMLQSGSKTRSLDWYTFELGRLEQQRALLQSLQNNPPKFQVSAEETAKDKAVLEKAGTTYQDAMDDYVKAKNTLDNTPELKEGETAVKDKPTREKATNDLKTKSKALAQAEADLRKAKADSLGLTIKTSSNNSVDTMVGKGGYIESQITDVDAKIKTYNGIIDAWYTTGPGVQEARGDGLLEDTATQAKLPTALPDPEISLPADQGKSKSMGDFFTSINVSVSQSSSKTSTTSSTMAYGGGVSASYGMLGVSAGLEHSDAHTSAMSELASCDVDISFEVMRVDISRSWLRSELFYDSHLRPGPHVKLSPGPYKLKALLERSLPGKSAEEMQRELDVYNTFPMYPTAFYVAANVILEIKGSTSRLQSYMNTSSTSGNIGVSYGPFNINASFSKSDSDASSECKATSTGCRITVKAPQIIAWVSNILPALPRLESSPTW